MPSSGDFRRPRSTRELPVYLSRHGCCSTWRKLWCASTEACTSGCGAFNTFYQKRIIIPLEKTHSGLLYMVKRVLRAHLGGNTDLVWVSSMWEGRGGGGVGGVNPNVLMHFFVHQNILDCLIEIWGGWPNPKVIKHNLHIFRVNFNFKFPAVLGGRGGGRPVLTESHFEYAFFMNFIPDPLHAKSTNNELLGDQSCNLK